MKIILEDKEVLELVHNALCNGGLSELAMCGVRLNVSKSDYERAKVRAFEHIDSDTVCREDVWVQILRSGQSLKFYDFEGEEEICFDLKKAKENLSRESASKIILDYKEGNDDAITATELLQHCLYGEVIFG
jgi:hypothetical protein